MNLLIEQLAEQAASTIDTTRGNTYVSHPDFNKKFAELIVKECAELMYGRGDTIKKHFGVEE